jgi:photosystem II stability/assembly factor-like uncharacterized protein
MNGGLSWSDASDGIKYPLSSVFFIPSGFGTHIGYIAGVDFSGHGIILKTLNGGATWSVILTGVGFASIYFTDANTGYGVGNSGSIFKTLDGGMNWNSLSSGTLHNLTSVYFHDSNIGYVVGQHGIILKTINGGANWTILTNVRTNNLNSVVFTDDSTGYAAGEGIILKTTDGGSDWTVSLLSTGAENLLNSICFPASNTGYAVGEFGTILSTNNGGTDWNVLSSGTNYILNSVFFTGANTGYAVGWGGTILKTSDGGTDFIKEPPRSKEMVFTIYPNPANNRITISFKSKFTEEINVSIFNITGEQIIQGSFYNQNHIQMDVSKYAKGIYLVKIRTKTGVESKKLVMQ